MIAAPAGPTRSPKPRKAVEEIMINAASITMKQVSERRPTAVSGRVQRAVGETRRPIRPKIAA